MVRAFFLLFAPLAVLIACHECSTETCTDYAKVVINTTDGTWVELGLRRFVASPFAMRESAA